MIKKYFFARLKKSKLLTALGALAMFFVCFVLILATSLPNIIESSVKTLGFELYGDADILIANSENIAVPFDIGELKKDGDINENIEYLYGYFMSVAEVDYNGNKEFCTLLAADYTEQAKYNPICGSNLPDDITDAEIIIGKKYASKLNINWNDKLKITFLNKTITFDVVAVAENKGLFVVGNAVIISPKGLKRFGLPSGLVTHAFIKTNNNAQAYNKVVDAIKNNEYFAHLGAGEAIGVDLIGKQVLSVMMPTAYISALVVVFCAVTLAIILRLTFVRDNKNFNILRRLGATNKHILAINELSTIIIALLGTMLSVVGLYFLQNFIRQSSFLLKDISLGVFPYIIGVCGGILVSVVCAWLSSKDKSRQNKNLSKTNIYSFIPSIMYAKKPNTFTLEVKTMAKSKEWQKYFMFAFLGVVVICLLVLSMVNMRFSIDDSANKITNTNGLALSFNHYFASFFQDYIWMFDLLCIFMILLIIITIVCVSVLNKLKDAARIKQLISLGMSKPTQIKSSLFASAYLCLPLLILSPLFMFGFSFLTSLTSKLFSESASINFRFAIVATTSLLCYFAIVAIEAISCLVIYPSSKISNKK